MRIKIQTITLPLPYKMGNVNCYLLRSKRGFVLVDTGSSSSRDQLMEELDKLGCKGSNLNLIVLTHGDFDHSGNATYLRTAFGTRIAMHYYDSPMVESGDMFSTRENTNPLVRKLVPVLFKFRKAERFKPDIYLREGSELDPFGLEAKVLHLPGHSRGSIGILTQAGDLICGDLLENIKHPTIDSMMDDMKSARASIKRLNGFPIKTVYPGHGQPFPFETLDLTEMKE